MLIKKERYKKVLIKTTRFLFNNLIMVISIIFLISFINNVFGTTWYRKLFFFNDFRDSIVGAILGSISVGNPLNSYVLAGEFLKSGVSLLAVTSFIVAWTTVGIVQLHYEMETLGQKFAIWRNFLSFIFAILVSVTTVLIYNLL